MKRRLLLAIAAAAVASGCASPMPADYAAEKPVLDLKTYFNGKLLAHGIFSDRSGKVVRRFVVELTGTWKGNQGELDERFTYSDGKSERRVWRLVDQGGGRYEGRAERICEVSNSVRAILELAGGLKTPEGVCREHRLLNGWRKHFDDSPNAFASGLGPGFMVGGGPLCG